jgi:hypothetical protein
MKRMIIFYFIISIGLLIQSADAVVNTRLTEYSHTYDDPSAGKATLIIDVEAVSSSGTVSISGFQDAFQLDANLRAQSPSVSFSDILFSSSVYNITHDYQSSDGRARYIYTYNSGTLAQIGTSWTTVLRVTIEYTMTSGSSSISWYAGNPDYTVTDDTFNFVTGSESAIPPELTDFSLPVELNTFTAEPGPGLVTLEWATQSEIDNQGFNVFRSEQKNGEYKQINGELIDGAGTTTSMTEYSYIDDRVEVKTYYYKLQDISIDGQINFHGPVQVVVEKSAIPDDFNLKQNYPNPFNPTTQIQYGLPEQANVEIQIINLTGQVVRTLVNTYQDAGTYDVTWNGRADDGTLLPSGVYLYRINAGKFTDIKKMIFTK